MKNNAQKFISNTMAKKAIDLFLRQIGIMPESVYFKSDELRKVIYDYINSEFYQIHCCVLWYKTMQDPDNPIVMYLRKNKIDTKYEKFSLILNEGIIRLSSKESADMRVIFKDPQPIKPNFSVITY